MAESKPNQKRYDAADIIKPAVELLALKAQGEDVASKVPDMQLKLVLGRGDESSVLKLERQNRDKMDQLLAMTDASDPGNTSCAHPRPSTQDDSASMQGNDQTLHQDLTRWMSSASARDSSSEAAQDNGETSAQPVTHGSGSSAVGGSKSSSSSRGVAIADQMLAQGIISARDPRWLCYDVKRASALQARHKVSIGGAPFKLPANKLEEELVRFIVAGKLYMRYHGCNNKEEGERVLLSSNQTFGLGWEAIAEVRRHRDNQDQSKAACNHLIGKLNDLKDLTQATATYRKQLLQLSAFLDKTLNDRLSMIEKHRQECLFKKEHSRAAADQNNSTTTSDANNVHASPWTPAASSCWAADDTYAVVTHNETSPLNSSADLVNSSSMFDNVANGFSSFTASVGQGVSSFVGMLWS